MRPKFRQPLVTATIVVGHCGQFLSSSSKIGPLWDVKEVTIELME
jgi:hypothetical protein